SEFVQLSSVLEKTFDYEDKIKEVANRVFEKQHLFFLGRGLDVLSAMEGSLKLKEISYIHSEAYPAGELKHGSLALIEEGTPVVVLNSQRHLAAKTESNAMEVKARGGFVLMVSDLEDDLSFADEILLLPSCGDTLSIFPITIVLQLFAYHVALLKGHDVDQPRHLAKSVTVE
ncbi:MAG: SIS domain-containing protein, partial [Erysipelothrix sp.]|nr:SIS domain-containing protein [Erysipelothrix sp.]